MRAISFLFGFMLFVLGTVGFFVLAGGNLPALLMVFPMLAIVIASLGSAILAFGVAKVGEALLKCRFLFIAPSGEIRECESLGVIRYLITSTYASGGLIFLLCLIITLSNIGAPLNDVGRHIAACICSLMYSIFMNELGLRPLWSRLESDRVRTNGKL